MQKQQKPAGQHFNKKTRTKRRAVSDTVFGMMRGGVAVQTLTTDAAGSATVQQMEPGAYTIVEIGYQ